MLKPYVVIGLVLFLTIPYPALAGDMVVEYAGDFNLGDSIYSAKLAVGDFDSDGRDDIIISDDYGSFHIFALHNHVFDELWISDPLDTEMGAVKWLGLLESDQRSSRVFALDSKNQLHMYSYKGYVFGETSSWGVPSEGYLAEGVIISPSPAEYEFLKLSMVSGYKFIVETFILGDESTLTRPALGVNSPVVAMPAIVLQQGSSDANLLIITGNEPNAKKRLSKQYILEVTTMDGKTLSSFPLDGYNPEEESIALSAIGAGGKIIALGFGALDDVGHLKMRFWHEAGDEVKPGGWCSIAAHRDVAAGDVDGDGRTEFVTVGIDGLVRILDEDQLKYSLDGKTITSTKPATIEYGEIYQDAGFLKKLGIRIVEYQDTLMFSADGMLISFTGGPLEWFPSSENDPPLEIKIDPYGAKLYPLNRICIALGFAFRFRSDLGTVEVYS